MQKINYEFVHHAFSGAGSLQEYADATSDIALWASEKMLFEQYFDKKASIMDLGCGTGRVTFGLKDIGYQHVIGVDFCEPMLLEAKKINHKKGYDLSFFLGDATNLQFDNQSFDCVVFAYNGLMQIPGQNNRLKAFQEIYRVLNPGGIFIFTTHDMEADLEHVSYWKQEERLWTSGKQNPRLVDFGDLIYRSYDREMFMHVPKREEILDYIAKSGFLWIEDRYRPEMIDESEDVKNFSDECRFWVVKKQ